MNKQRAADALLWLGLAGVVAVFSFGAVAMVSQNWNWGLHVIVSFYSATAALLAALVLEKFL